VVQVSNAGVGFFMDVTSLSILKIGRNEQWVVEGGFRTNKSKSWRVFVRAWHEKDFSEQPCGLLDDTVGYYIGLQVEL
jgi:hypothetical protein